MTIAILRRLFRVNPRRAAEIRRNLQPHLEAIRESERLTADDYAVTVTAFNYGAVGEPEPSTAADIVQVHAPRGHWLLIDRTAGMILDRSERRFAGVPPAAHKKPLVSRREVEAAEDRRRAAAVESRGNGE